MAACGCLLFVCLFLSLLFVACTDFVAVGEFRASAYTAFYPVLFMYVQSLHVVGLLQTFVCARRVTPANGDLALYEHAAEDIHPYSHTVMHLCMHACIQALTFYCRPLAR